VVVICDPLVVRRPDHVVIGGRWRGPSVSDGGAGVPAGPGGWIRRGSAAAEADSPARTRAGSSGPCRAAVRTLRPWSGRRIKAWGLAFFRPHMTARPQAARLAVAGRTAGRGGAGRGTPARPVPGRCCSRISSWPRGSSLMAPEVPVQPLQRSVGGVADDDDLLGSPPVLQPLQQHPGVPMGAAGSRT
jgi:hypothetical protein